MSEKICPCGADYNFTCKCSSKVVQEFKNSPTEHIGKYLSVKKRDKLPKYKTDVWWVVSNTLDCLGVIKWYGAWREYALYPSPDTVFNKKCMEDLCAFLDKANAERKAKRKDPKIIQTGVPELDAILDGGIPADQIGKFE